MSLLELLPGFYGASLETADLEKAIEPEIVRLWADRDGLFDQLNVETATWGLDLWERDLGLSTDASTPADIRRSRIKSKLRGQGTTTAALIQNVAESFSGAKVELAEQPAAYTFTLKFLNIVGSPPGLRELSAAIEELKPAHLGYRYIITYHTWRELAGRPWGSFAGKTWGDLKEGTI